MESAAKRKAASAASPENDSRPAKRQKVPDESSSTETPATTTTMGLKFMESLKQAKDKTGRPISTHFLELPDKKDLPEYYDVIKLPVSIGTMEAKLNRGGYDTLAQLEGDCKRLVNNAKSFNDKKSIIYEDAERLRKTASNWMVRHNPAYRKQGYAAVATPIPGEEPTPPGRPIPRVAAVSTPSKISTPTPVVDSTERPRRAAAAAQPVTPAPSKLRHSASAAPDDGNPDFAGKNFQQAQEQLVREMIDFTDQGLQIFLPFVNLPSRSLKDYYSAIKNPISLSAVKKRVQGVIGRNPPTGMTIYKSWNAFEKDMALIWENAKDYNEDGSDIYELAVEFEDTFKARLAEAKAKVDEPPQPKLKLNMSAGSAVPPKQTMKLKLGSRQSPGSDPNTPGGRSSATPGFIVDSDALLRQQRHVQDSMTSNKNSRPSSAGKQSTPSAAANPFTSTRGASSSIAPTNAAAKAAGSPPVTNGIKTDVQSPALNAIRPASTASDSQSQRLSVQAQTPVPGMAPPGTSRPASGSPHPNGPLPQGVGYNAPQFQAPNYYVPPATPQFDHFRRAPLKSLGEALIPKITMTTSPSITVPTPFKQTITASRSKTSISYTVNLDPGNSYLHIVPSLPIALTGRPYRAFVSVNGNRIMESSRLPVTASLNGLTVTPGFDGAKKKGEPLYEAKLAIGLNRIEIEVIAERDRKGKPESKDPKEMVDIEKCTIFANLRR